MFCMFLSIAIMQAIFVKKQRVQYKIWFGKSGSFSRVSECGDVWFPRCQTRQDFVRKSVDTLLVQPRRKKAATFAGCVGHIWRCHSRCVCHTHGGTGQIKEHKKSSEIRGCSFHITAPTLCNSAHHDEHGQQWVAASLRSRCRI